MSAEAMAIVAAAVGLLAIMRLRGRRRPLDPEHIVALIDKWVAQVTAADRASAPAVAWGLQGRIASAPTEVHSALLNELIAALSPVAAGSDAIRARLAAAPPAIHVFALAMLRQLPDVNVGVRLACVVAILVEYEQAKLEERETHEG